VAELVEQEPLGGLGRAEVRATLARVRAAVAALAPLAPFAIGACLAACDRAGARPEPTSDAVRSPAPACAPRDGDAIEDDASALAHAREELARVREESAAEGARQSARIRALESELASATDERVEREKKWLEYAQGMTKLGAIAGAPPPPSAPDPVLERAVASSALTSVPQLSTSAALDDAALATAAIKREAPAAKPDPLVSAVEKRDRDVFVALRSLFMVEQVGGFDLLESGTLHDGATGPVVLRVLDDRGHPLGAIYAERMRLEGSRAARTLTIVLEDGHERRGGARTPFAEVQPNTARAGSPAGASEPTRDAPASGPRNARRIVLPDIDPEPWITALPELFAAEAKEPPPDDGLWNLEDVRAALNVLLRQDASGGYYRVQSLAGVQGDTLRDVQLDSLDRDGKLERKLFADRLRCLAEERGVMIQLESGAQLRGDEKTPFLDGRYRIFFPRADTAEWRRAGIPGFSPVPSAKGRAPSR
jgi:hypothetical protein